jgi:transporter family protein
MSGTPETRQNARRTLLLPRWLWYSLFAMLTWGVWGVTSKAEIRYVDALLGQLLLTIGWMPLVLAVVFSKNLRTGTNLPKGTAYALLTGFITCAGNIAFLAALSKGGPASTVVPVCGLYPLVTVISAVLFLKERVNRVQVVGIGLALVAIFLLSEG